MSVKTFIVLSAILTAWQLLAWLLPTSRLVTPIDILSAFMEPSFSSKLVEAYALTAIRALAGFALGLAAGVGLGVLASLRGWAVDVVEGAASLAVSVPSVAWIPLLIALMGIDELKLPVAVSFLCSFPPVLYQTVSAVRSIDPEEVMVARSLGAKGFYLWRTIILPAVIEKVFPAVKIEAAMVWKTVFAAEMVALPNGLGYLAMLYADLLDARHVAAVVVVLAATVASIVHILSLVEKRVLKARGWGVEAWSSMLEL